MNELGTELPRMRVLFVQGSNPAVTAPRQRLVLDGLGRDDLFTVVHDQVLTDTALYADVVLPATTHFEADDLAGSYGSFTRQRIAAVIDRVGESRTNDEVGAGLAARLGLDMTRYGTDPDALMKEGFGGASPARCGGRRGAPRAGHSGPVPRHVPRFRGPQGAARAIDPP